MGLVSDAVASDVQFPQLEYADEGELRQLAASKIVEPAERARTDYVERTAALYKVQK